MGHNNKLLDSYQRINKSKDKKEISTKINISNKRIEERNLLPPKINNLIIVDDKKIISNESSNKLVEKICNKILSSKNNMLSKIKNYDNDSSSNLSEFEKKNKQSSIQNTKIKDISRETKD